MPLPLAAAYWVHNLSPFLVRFSDTIGIRYYGLAYVLGFLAAVWLLIRYARAGRSLLPEAQVWDFIMAIMLGVMLGGRLGSYLLYDGWRTFPEDPFAILRVWDGGMASHGGFLGVAAALGWFAWRSKIPYLHLSDLIASTTSVGLLLGRLANFINGELWGKVTDVAWAVIFPRSLPGVPVALVPPRHPSQLYEAALEGALLLAFSQWRFWRTDIVRRKPGQLAGEYLIAYAIVRAIGEVFREPDEGITLIFGLSRGTFYSLFLVGIGAWYVSRRPQSEAGATPPVGSDDRAGR